MPNSPLDPTALSLRVFHMITVPASQVSTELTLVRLVMAQWDRWANMTRRKWKSMGWVGFVGGALIAFFLLGPYALEPTDGQRIEDVTVVAYRRGPRGSEYFSVTSVVSGKSWEVGAASAPYPPEYRGPAVVSITRGRWTGRDHFRLLSERTQ